VNITTIQSETGIPLGESRDMVAWVGQGLYNGVVVTAVPDVYWFAGYTEATLAVRNVRIEGKVQGFGHFVVTSTFVHWTVENVGNTATGRFRVYVDRV
jgi:hypothetical protein